MRSQRADDGSPRIEAIGRIRRLDAADISGRELAAAVGIASAAGLLVRVYFQAQDDFPLNDGGLFLAMVRDLRGAHFALPAFTSYNSTGIPYAYPPLAFYLAGLLSGLTGLCVLELIRLLPLAFSVLTIPAFALLARELLPSRTATALAVFAFALLPGSFRWLIMGGGLTRAPGLLFAILSLRQAYLLYRSGERWRVIPTSLLCGLTVLTHPGMTWFAAYSVALFLMACGRNARGFAHSMLVAGGTLLLSAPWWGSVLARHGFAPLLSATAHDAPFYSSFPALILLSVSMEPFFPLLGSLALLGVLHCLANRRLLLLPAWLVAVFALDGPTSPTTASAPLALLAGVGAAEVVLPLMMKGTTRGSVPAGGDEEERDGSRAVLRPNRSVEVVLAFFLFHAAFSALSSGGVWLRPLSSSEREAMNWVSSHTPPDGTFLVISGDHWATDSSSEWFPVLAERRSVATVQGCEWLPGFATRVLWHSELQTAVGGQSEFLDNWARRAGVSFTYVYLAKKPGGLGQPRDRALALRQSLRGDARYSVVYDGPGATVFARR